MTFRVARNGLYRYETLKLNDESLDLILKENDYNFNAHATGFNAYGGIGTYVNMALYNMQLKTESPLRHRVAYALHQSIVASQSLDRFFKRRYDALAYYYDQLTKYAFSDYDKLLYDVSLTPAMAVFLTYMDNKKKTTVNGKTTYPDENYGREIMQLFSIGLYKKDMGGSMVYRDTNKLVANYTEDDVKAMSSVFTGLSMTTRGYSSIEWSGRAHYPLLCRSEWHDSNDKTLLGETIPGGQDCYKDIHSAIDILMKQDSLAPSVTKKLIMRLTKSNPTTAYVQRVAQAFKQSNNNIGVAVKTLLLDEEIWEDLKSKRATKLKEPFLAFMGALKALDAKPKKGTGFGQKTATDALDDYYYFPGGFFAAVMQQPLGSPTVFNYYADDFMPRDSEFMIRGFVAPELQIETRRYLTGYSRLISSLFSGWPRSSKEVNYFRRILNDPSKDPYRDVSFNCGYAANANNNFIIDTGFAYDAVLKGLSGYDAIYTKDKPQAKEQYTQIVGRLVDSISKRLLGRKLSDDKRKILVDTYGDPSFYNLNMNNPDTIYEYWISPITQLLLQSDDYMVQ
jgi:uncharacterized protein (DUF1800 family)